MLPTAYIIFLHLTSHLFQASEKWLGAETVSIGFGTLMGLIARNQIGSAYISVTLHQTFLTNA